MKQNDWKSLGFDPKKDGYWATADRIRSRIKERDRQHRKARIITTFIVLGVIAILTFLVWVLV